MLMIDYNSMDLVQILTKIDTDNCLWMPYKCTKFQLDWSKICKLQRFFQVCKETKKKKKNKTLKVCPFISQKRFMRFSLNLVCNLPW